MPTPVDASVPEKLRGHDDRALSKRWRAGISPRRAAVALSPAVADDPDAREMEVMHPRSTDRWEGLAQARRDFLADWRGWSLAERLTALATVLMLALAPFLVLTQSAAG